MPGRRKPNQPIIRTDGWLVSYGDLVTTLLCFFIILTALATDQTGFKLYAGLESFRESRKTFGAFGMLPRSNQAVKLEAFKQTYSVAPRGEKDNSNGTNEEQDGLPLRTLDAEEEQLQRYLNEMARTFKVDKMPTILGQATLDFYVRFNQAAPYLKPHHLGAIQQLVSLLKKPDYQIMVIVWPGTPSETAWLRSAEQARAVVEEIATTFRLDASSRAQLVPFAQPWQHSDYQRPVFSLIVVKSGAAH